MNIQKINTSLDGVYKIVLDNFSDDRGNIVNLFDTSTFPQFKIDKLTKSRKNVLRGLHGDCVNDKLIYCLSGKFHLVIVNLDKSSHQFLEKYQIDMDENSNFAIFIPRNFLNGHYCLSDTCSFFYKWSDAYLQPSSQISVRWDDIDLGIVWPLLESMPHISERDKNSKFLKEVI